MRFRLLLLHSFRCLFFSVIAPLLSVLDKTFEIEMSLSLYIQLRKSFVFGDFKAYHVAWLHLFNTIDTIAIQSFSILILSLKQSTSRRFPNNSGQRASLLDLFLASSLDCFCVLQLYPLGNTDHAVVSVDIPFDLTVRHGPLIHKTYCCYQLTDWDPVRDFLRHFPSSEIIRLPTEKMCLFPAFSQIPNKTTIFTHTQLATIAHRVNFYLAIRTISLNTTDACFCLLVISAYLSPK